MFGISNPQALLRPWKNISQFAEELYAMLSSPAPVERDGPVTIKVRPGQTALKLTRGDSDAAQATAAARPARPVGAVVSPRSRPSEAGAPRARTEPPRFSVGGADEAPRRPMPGASPAQDADRYQPVPPAKKVHDRQRQAKRAAEARRRPDTNGDDREPVLHVDGATKFSGSDPVRFETPPQVFNPRTRKWYTPPGFSLPDTTEPSLLSGGGGATVFIGKVASGTGDTYQVALYQLGPSGPPDGITVEVTIPMIDPSETIPVDAWLYGIYEFTDVDGNLTYSCQPPVWMA